MSVGDLAGPVVDVVSCTWPLVSERAGYVCKLEENLESLEIAKEQLESDYEVTKIKVEDEEKLLRKCIPKVASWLDRVKTLLENVRKTLQEGEVEKQKKCLIGGYPKNCWSSYRLGKRVCKLINEVDKRKVEGKFDDLTFKEDLTIREYPKEETVGLDSMLQEVWDRILDPKLGIIGLYGIGGVGKTTLLKKINNEFLNRRHEHDFKTVILVDAKQSDQELQKAILKASGISAGNWENTSIAEKAWQITHILQCKKFVLLLDDVGKRLELLTIGVPLPDDQNKSKVVFTTRSEEVCAFMESDENIEVTCLKSEHALDLFRKKVGGAALSCHSSIPALAEEMASLCAGLPLILITVGRAMAVRKTREEWITSRDLLKRHPSKIAGMSAVLELLETSFNSMLDPKGPNGPNLKLCFTYCYMFPERYSIRKEQLIEHWISEGFLDEFHVGGSRRAMGEYYIGNLKQYCLLESGESEEFVRMHDVIYAQNFWGYKKKILILTQRGANSNEAHRDWNEVERISLWDHNIQDLHINGLQFYKIKTLLCKAPNLKQFPNGFFNSMLALRVLDLSDSSDLGELPGEIGSLICLEYLNLSRTAVVEMPIVLQKLTKMKCLMLDYMKNLQEIPRAVISALRLLEVFSNLVSSNKRCSAKCLLEDLERLPQMSEICIAIENSTSVQRLLGSEKLQHCIRKLSLFYCEALPSIELSPSLLSRIEHLEFFNCIDLKELKISPVSETAQNHSFDHLFNVKIVSGQFSDVTWLTYAPSLKTLTLIDCKSMEEVILGDREDIFLSLTALHLEDLPCLKSICLHALPFQSLTKVEVQQCPRLEKLPFDSNSAKSLELINGEQSWWNGLKWEDEAIKRVFSSAFVER